ncbi:MAG: hypothetical protein AAF526_03165 [Pseudomonadota bacterium]
MLFLLTLCFCLLVGLPASAETSGWKERLNSQLHVVEAAVAQYRDIDVARAEGWRSFGGAAPLMGEHWTLRGRQAPIADQPIDLTRPHNLMYSKIGDRYELTGVAFMVRLGDFDPMPDGFAGPDDIWHVHNAGLILKALGEARPLTAWLGRRIMANRLAPDGRERLAMVHFWLDGRSPDGVFAERDRSLPYRRLGLGQQSWDGRSVAASFGIALAHPEGCEEELKGKLWLAGASGQTKRAAYAACDAASGTVKAALADTPGKINQTAIAAWTRFQADLEEILSSDERRRIASLLETGCQPSEVVAPSNAGIRGGGEGGITPDP